VINNVPMTEALDLEPWHDLMVATVGAMAALTGLLFVAISINVDMIIHERRLPGRAAATLVMLVMLLLAGVLVLIPDQPSSILGAEIGVLGVLVTILCAFALRPRQESKGRLNTYFYRYFPLMTMLVPCVALLVAGVSTIAQVGGGLYWLAAAFVTGTMACTLNAWVLLIEIKR